MRAFRQVLFSLFIGSLLVTACDGEGPSQPLLDDPWDAETSSRIPVVAGLSDVPITGALSGPGPVVAVADPSNPESSGIQGSEESALEGMTSDRFGSGSGSLPEGPLLGSGADGYQDLLWRLRTPGTGYDVLWEMEGLTRKTVHDLPRVSNLDWEVVAVADFTDDGVADIVWRNSSTGDNVIWEMDGTGYSKVHSLNRVINTDWEIKSAADFCGDATPDLVWHNVTTGDNVVWEMSGPAYVSVHPLERVPNTAWDIKGAGDLTGDGNPDLVWRYGVNGYGYNVVWQMAGCVKTAVQELEPVKNTDWALEAVGDLTGDGWPDFLWRLIATGKGDNVVWEMHGPNKVAVYPLPVVKNTDWHLVGIGSVITSGPKLSVTPLDLDFQAVEGTNPSPQSFLIQNIGGGTLNWVSASDNPNRIALSPLNGTLGPGETQNVQVDLDVWDLTEGSYEDLGTIQIAAPGADGTPQQVSVDLVITAEPVGGVEASVLTAGFRADENGYQILLTNFDDFTDQVSVSNNDAVGWYEIPIGSYIMSLDGEPSHCSLNNGARNRSVTIAAGQTASVYYDIVCADPSGYQIQVEFRDAGALTGTQRTLIETGIQRWEEVILDDLTAVIDFEEYDNMPCGEVESDIDVDDMLMYVYVESIDGDGGEDGLDVWAAARTCYSRGGGGAPFIGIMTIDEYNLPEMSNQDLTELATHETAHSVGFSSYHWNRVDPGLEVTGGDGVRRFTGTNATSQYVSIGGEPSGVPLWTSSHWDETIFNTEIMTPYLERDVFEALSSITIGLLDDLYYSVDYSAADPYTLPSVQMAPRETLGRRIIDVESPLPPKEEPPQRDRIPPVRKVGGEHRAPEFDPPGVLRPS